MKIVIPVNENSENSKVCQSFGRAPYFMVYNTDSKKSTFINNSAAASQGGAGIKAAQTVADQSVKALLTPRCGQNAADVITAANITIYKTVSDSIKESIKSFLDGKLTVLANIHPGFHNH